jgi:hypothetical protein
MKLETFKRPVLSSGMAVWVMMERACCTRARLKAALEFVGVVSRGRFLEPGVGLLLGVDIAEVEVEVEVEVRGGGVVGCREAKYFGVARHVPGCSVCQNYLHD